MLAGSHRNAWPDETGTGGRTNRNTQKSIWIRKTAHRWYVSFSYEDGHIEETISNNDHLNYLNQLSEQELEALITPVDRGVAKPLHTHNAIYTLTIREKAAIAQRERKLKRYQRKMARQVKGSNQRKNTIKKISA